MDTMANIAGALALHLQKRYPKMGIHRKVKHLGITEQIDSKSGLLVILIGSKVLLTRGKASAWPSLFIYDPEIDLTHPDSLDLIHHRIESYWSLAKSIKTNRDDQ